MRVRAVCVDIVIGFGGSGSKLPVGFKFKLAFK